MGNSVCKRALAEKQVRITILGLSSAGKTSTLYTMKLGEVPDMLMFGTNSELINHRDIPTVVYDVGGRERNRSMYRLYNGMSNGLVYVIDSSDKESFDDAIDDLRYMLGTKEMDKKPVLVLANKQDLPNAMSPTEITEKLQKERILRNNQWEVFGVAVGKGNEGLYDAFDWLVTAIVNREKNKFAEYLIQGEKTGKSVVKPRFTSLMESFKKMIIRN